MTYTRTWKKNRRKVVILAAVARASGQTHAQIAGAVGIFPTRQVAADLVRYSRWGYVRRWRAAGRWRYELTRRGEERLRYFQSQKV